MKTYVYIIKNLINGKKYCGIAKRINIRWNGHKSCAKKKIKHPLYNSMNKHGIDNFIMEPIFLFDTRNEAKEMEMNLISCFKLQNREFGYNLTKGGDNGGGLVGHKHSEETKRKMSLSAKGRVFSEETKQKLSLAKKNKSLSDGHKKKISLANTGKKRPPMPEEHRKKISIAMKGKPSKNKGKTLKPLSDEHKQKISITNTGKNKGKTAWNKGKICKPLSDEHKKKISLASAGRHSLRKGKTWKLINGKRVWS